MSNNNEEGGRRAPRNMQELLKFAIEAGGDDHSQEPDHIPMDSERREFLESAVNSLTIDIVEQIRNKISLLRAVSTYKEGDDIAEFVAAMDELADYLENIDLANDFCKLGGFDMCLAWILRGPAELRWRSAQLIAVCSQNNPFCQIAAVGTNRLKPLMETALTDSDTTVRLKAFYAVSCIIRENSDGLIQFLSLNGHKLILSSLQSHNIKLQTKAAFLLSAIASKEPMFKDELAESGLIGELALLVAEAGGKEDVSVEHLLSAMLAVVCDHNRAQEVLAKSPPSFRLAIDRIINEHSKDPAYQEEVTYARQILKLLMNQK